MVRLLEELLRVVTVPQLETGETGGKVLLQGLGSTGNLLLQELQQAFPSGNAPGTPSPLRSKWVIALSIVLAAVIFLASLMCYYYRCGCSVAKNKRTPVGV